MCHRSLAFCGEDFPPFVCEAMAESPSLSLEPILVIVAGVDAIGVASSMDVLAAGHSLSCFSPTYYAPTD